MAAISCEKDGNILAKRVARKLHVVQQTGCDLSLLWIPSHTGKAGNEVADCAATVAHDPNTGVTNFVSPRMPAVCSPPATGASVIPTLA
ncbi:hypothetical protein MRX96_026075 [Rhipicephalus microplus]